VAERSSSNPVEGRPLAEAMLAALSARPAAALLTTPTVRLITDTFQPTPVSDPAAFTEPAFTGYAAVSLPTPAGPVGTPSQGVALAATVNFIASATPSPTVNVTGYIVTDSANPPTTLYYAEKFTTPVAFINALDFLTLNLLLPIQAQQSAN